MSNICKASAILFHYFFLSVYAWLMNEGFNVYISITYTAHNQHTQDNSGHWRHYIIGWGVPGILVSAIVGSTFDDYFSKDMCFVSWDSIWLFAGPPLAMICVTLLVLTFAAKENNEVSYTKNESANTMTEYHVNAVWTQLILVTCTWAIAFLSLKYKSLVFKWVFFIFNCAQGSFLLVFFFLLNEEVRSVFKSKEIKQQLGWDISAPSPNSSPREERIPLTYEQRQLYGSDSSLTANQTQEERPLTNKNMITLTPDQLERNSLPETNV
ncbi:GPR98 [Bugula neritina]|uniref:GPR98 n=1 Tax=Bugula neritina TaxID=10212 RepID=A0A7J7J4H4_BUGNE|nr:GPR98 [Bugula neritina]